MVNLTPSEWNALLLYMAIATYAIIPSFKIPLAEMGWFQKYQKRSWWETILSFPTKLVGRIVLAFGWLTIYFLLTAGIMFYYLGNQTIANADHYYNAIFSLWFVECIMLKIYWASWTNIGEKREDIPENVYSTFMCTFTMAIFFSAAVSLLVIGFVKNELWLGSTQACLAAYGAAALVSTIGSWRWRVNAHKLGADMSPVDPTAGSAHTVDSKFQ
jgi:hypothetical protein